LKGIIAGMPWPQSPEQRITQCGSGLARESGISVIASLTDTPLSRASPLPHLICVYEKSRSIARLTVVLIR
jgi:hypothetical protein